MKIDVGYNEKGESHTILVLFDQEPHQLAEWIRKVRAEHGIPTIAFDVLDKLEELE